MPDKKSHSHCESHNSHISHEGTVSNQAPFQLVRNSFEGFHWWGVSGYLPGSHGAERPKGIKGKVKRQRWVPTAQPEVGDEKGFGNLRRSLRDAGLEWQQTTEIFSLFGDCHTSYLSPTPPTACV